MAVRTTSRTLRAGRSISALCVLFLLFDGAAKVLQIEPVVKANIRLGYTAGAVPGVGILLLCCTLVYAVPRTSVLGAVLLTGFLGGATATLVRVGDPFMFPVVVGILLWVGLFLRNDRLTALVPLLQADR